MTAKPLRYTFVLVALLALTVFAVTALVTILAEIYRLSLSQQLAVNALTSVGLAIAIAWLTLGTSPMLKDILATFRTLSRLESLSHPLLLRLSREAPGTYHHSLQVGTLANHAAHAIGADALLARLGGYYHDVGKLTQPTYFIENQQGGENSLTIMSPRQAAKVIIAHIDDGLALAKEYKLPAELVAFIPQHTGTTTVRYFLEKAKQRGKRNWHEDQFRYPGPKPQTREAGIVMLADSIEAKARLLRDPDRPALERLVADTLADKTESGQLDLAGFVRGDFDKLRASFADTLATMMHQRIAYPTDEQEYNEGAL